VSVCKTITFSSSQFRLIFNKTFPRIRSRGIAIKYGRICLLVPVHIHVVGKVSIAIKYGRICLLVPVHIHVVGKVSQLRPVIIFTTKQLIQYNRVSILNMNPIVC